MKYSFFKKYFMIKVQNLSKSFGPTKAVDDLSFEIQSGEVVGFLGPNGAGKTTTIRLLTGFLSPDNGTIDINNINVAQNPTHAQKQIGYLAENNPMYKDMLVSEFLDLIADLNEIDKNKRKQAFDFVVSAVNIENVYYKQLSQLSKGFKQRVGIASVLIHQPQIIIMDEPTEGLDPNQRTEIRTLIKQLAKEHTIILSTHVMQEAQAVCSRMIIINNGQLVADGTADELARKSQREKIISMELEGDGIDFRLNNLPEVQKAEIQPIEDRKMKVKLIVNEQTLIQPIISSLVHEHKWVIWKMFEEQDKLEDIFQKLTQESINNQQPTNNESSISNDQSPMNNQSLISDQFSIADNQSLSENVDDQKKAQDDNLFNQDNK